MPQFLLITAQTDCHSQGTFPRLPGSRNGLGEAMSGPKRSGRELEQADVTRSSFPPPESSSSGPFSCLFQPPGGVPGTQPLLPNSMDPTRQQGRDGGAGCLGCVESGRAPSTLLSASATHSSPTLSRRAPQHGRINAENEPSPRHGAHGARPTGNCLSVRPSPWPSVCPRLLSSFHSLSVFPHCLACRGERRGCDLVCSCCLCPELDWPHTVRSSPLSRQS